MVQPVEDYFSDGPLPVFDTEFYPFGRVTMSADETTPAPSIDPNTPTNVTVIKGKTAMLACVVRNVGKAAVNALFITF